jgi:glucose-6-phosphate dehydrogenase assembly protein OpcA
MPDIPYYYVWWPSWSDASSHSFAPLARTGRTRSLGDSLEAEFQPANDPSDPAVIEMVSEAMRVYEYDPASEPK